MAWRIGEYIVKGELNNSKRNSVYGWLDFGGDWGVRIGLTGNMSGNLEGKHIRFSVRHRRDPESVKFDLEELTTEQIGVTGDMLIKTVKVIRGEINPDSIGRAEEKPCLYLEWYSQNGRVVAEIVDAEIEIVSEDEILRDIVSPADLLDFDSDQQGDESVQDESDLDYEDPNSFDESDRIDDEFNLFPTDLEDQISASANEGLTESFRDVPSESRSWDEVIPGIDAETKAMYEQWDEVFEGTSNEPVSTLFDPPIRLPDPSKVVDDHEAEGLLKDILIRLAALSVAIDICEHCSPKEAYRILIEDILPEANVHPNLSSIGMVQHYSTWETCPECEKEFESEFGDQSLGENDSDEDVPF